ncbi:hypothetical protein [Actinoplanes philippinensis]|uniref:hypothetical protein n=1 Tax=Actinoplanes philippinensis TaxID=35752 RepID=UPI0034112A29
MRPRLIAETTGHAGEFWPIPTGGWMTTHYNADHIWALDQRLELTASHPLDEGIPVRDGQRLALTRDDHVAIDGRRYPVPRNRACCLRGDVLWTLSDGDLLTAWQLTSGDSIRETRLGFRGAGVEWMTALAGGRTGLQIRPSDGSPARTWLLSTDAPPRELPGRLVDVHPDGARYLSAEPGRITLRDITTGAITAARSDEQIGGPEAVLSRGAALVSGTLAVVAIEDHSAWWWRHVLLCADTLQPRSVLDYPRTGEPYEIVRSAEPGTWLTTTDDRVHLWGLDGPLDTDPLPGQLTLL